MSTTNPEALHDVGQGKSKKVGDKFVNPGTPADPLVNRDQMTQAKIQGAANDILRANIVK